MAIRLQKIIAHRGYTSRRKAEQLIREGRVRVDGHIIDELGAHCSENAAIEIDGMPVADVSPVYLMMNKPAGYICSAHDPEGRPLVYDLLNSSYRECGVFTVGRLDFMSEGLLLLTNDGDFANTIAHPSSGILKKYLVHTDKGIPYKTIDGWKGGVYIKGVRYKIHDLQRISSKKVLLILAEGKNREIRRLFESINIGVRRLMRIGFGPLGLGTLVPGKYRTLTRRERDAVIRETRKKTSICKHSPEPLEAGRKPRA